MGTLPHCDHFTDLELEPGSICGACCVVPLPELQSLLLLERGLLLARSWPVGWGLSPGEDDLISKAKKGEGELLAGKAELQQPEQCQPWPSETSL